MNNKTKLRALLDEVIPAADEHEGPTRVEVLGMVRRERARRRRRQAAVTMAALAALLSLPMLWKDKHTAGPRTAEARPKPAPVTIEHVDDEQLFTLLEGTPAALMEWPNGERTLLVVKH